MLGESGSWWEWVVAVIFAALAMAAAPARSQTLPASTVAPCQVAADASHSM